MQVQHLLGEGGGLVSDVTAVQGVRCVQRRQEVAGHGRAGYLAAVHHAVAVVLVREPHQALDLDWQPQLSEVGEVAGPVPLRELLRRGNAVGAL